MSGIPQSTDDTSSKPPDPFLLPRETMLDRRVSITEHLVLDVPDVPPLCDVLPGLNRRRVRVGNVGLYCEEEGQGPPLVLIHGGPGSSHHSFHPGLSHLRDDARLLYYDQRGCGLSEYRSEGGYSIDQSVEDLEGLRRALGIERWSVLGHSYGGFLAQCYALKHPEAITSLVLVSTLLSPSVGLKPSPYVESLAPEERQRQEAILGRSELSPAQLVYNAQINGRWKRQSYYRPTLETIARWARFEWWHEPGYYDAICVDLYRYDLRGAFAHCPIATLLVEGRHDLTWNTDRPAALRSLFPAAGFVTFERSSHSPFQEEPERFRDCVAAFLRKAPAASAPGIEAWKKELAALTLFDPSKSAN